MAAAKDANEITNANTALGDLKHNFRTVFADDLKSENGNSYPADKDIPEEFTLVSVYIYAEVSNSDLKIVPNPSFNTKPLLIYNLAEDKYDNEVPADRTTDLKVARWRLREGGTLEGVDWREVLYQMALDYYDHHEEERFAQDLRQNNPDLVSATGLTGFEPFYADMQAFWRQLYNPEGLWEEGYIPSGTYKHWHESVLLNPETLNFWIDFLDTYGELEQYSMDVIGHRPYKDSNNGNKVTCVASKDIPEVLYWTIGDEAAPEEGELQALTPLQITPDMRNLFVIASNSQSAMSRINTLISNTTLMADAISLTTVPIYQILPNTRIYVHDDEAHVEGDYQVTNVTIPLSHTGNMSIAAAKIVKQIN